MWAWIVHGDDIVGSFGETIFRRIGEIRRVEGEDDFVEMECDTARDNGKIGMRLVVESSRNIVNIMKTVRGQEIHFSSLELILLFPAPIPTLKLPLEYRKQHEGGILISYRVCAT